MACKYSMLLFLALIMTFCPTACNGEDVPPAPVPAPTPKTTEVTPEPGVSGTIISGSYPAFTIDDCIQHSDTIVIGRVTDITPARWGENPASPLPRVIYQDVIIETERYLYGEPESELIAVCVWGGKIGDTYMAALDMPVFTVGERNLLCLHRPPEEVMQTVPEGITHRSYYRVTAGVPGKFDFTGGVLADYQGKAADTATFEERIAVVKNG